MVLLLILLWAVLLIRADLGASYQGGLAEVSSDLNLGKCCGTSSTGTYGTDTRVGALEAALSKFGFTDDSGRVYG